MAVPDGEFVIVVTCADCGEELNRSIPLTKETYTNAVLSAPLMTRPCPRGCRSTESDMNMNTYHCWERLDGTPIDKALYGIA